jgi:hypothetical protein
MTLTHVQLIVGTTNAASFRTYLTGTLVKSDNGQTYHEEDLNSYAKAVLTTIDPKTFGFKNKK